MQRFVHFALTAVFLAVTSAALAEDEKPRFHHVHINAVDPAKSIQYYTTMFSAVKTKYRGLSDAVLVDRSFILFNKVAQPAPWIWAACPAVLFVMVAIASIIPARWALAVNPLAITREN